VCLCSPSSINWYRLRLGVKCTTGAVLGMLAAIIGGPCGWRPTGATPTSFLAYLWLPLYSGLEVTFVTYAAI